MGGENLSKLYSEIYVDHPDSIVVVRQQLHVLAAKSAGFTDIRYLVPSIAVNQLREEFLGASLIRRLKIIAHMIVQGFSQRRALRIAKVFVFSRSMNRQVRKLLPKELKNKSIRIVKPGVDATRFNVASDKEKECLRNQLKLPTNKNLFLFVGRYVQAKGLDYVIDAIAMMPHDCALILVGEGEYEMSVREKIKNLKLETKVVLAGRTSRVEDYYRACDVFIMSSTYEPFGQTILEAASTGMRLVAFHPNSGVVTATNELGLDYAIDYANELTSASLANAMSKSLLGICNQGAQNISLQTQQLYSWSALLYDLHATE
jgi:glycosyltransferase involved in cell wall biosynthesis